MTRKQYLLDLIDSIYGKGNRRVNFDDFLIYRQSGLGDKVTQKVFKTRKSMGSYAEQFKKLFYMTFIEKDVEFDLDNSEGKYNRSKAYENARNYLKKNGVNFFVYGDITEQDYDNLIIKFINEQIVPAIFYSYVKEENCNDIGSETIDDEFYSAIKEINDTIFASAVIMRYRIKNKDILIINDTEYNERDYNYAIPMNMYSVGNPYVAIFPNIEAYVYKLIKAPKELQRKQESFEEMIKGYVKLPIDPNSFFEEQDSDYITIKSPIVRVESKHMPISTVSFTSGKMKDQYFYYVTSLNEYFLRSKHGEIKNHEDLDKYLKNKAKKDVDRFYKTKKYDYYHKLVEYIEDVVKRILQIDVYLFINNGSDDIEIYKKNIECFNIDSRYILEFLDDSMNKQGMIYYMIERIIDDFSNNLKKHGKSIVNELCIWLNKKDLEKHLKVIKGIIDSEFFDKAINIQTESVNKNPRIYKDTNKNYMMNAGLRIPNLFENLKAVLTDYFNCLHNK